MWGWTGRVCPKRTRPGQFLPPKPEPDPGDSEARWDWVCAFFKAACLTDNLVEKSKVIHDFMLKHIVLHTRLVPLNLREVLQLETLRTELRNHFIRTEIAWNEGKGEDVDKAVFDEVEAITHDAKEAMRETQGSFWTRTMLSGEPWNQGKEHPIIPKRWILIVMRGTRQNLVPIPMPVSSGTERERR